MANQWSFEQRRSALAMAENLARIAAGAPNDESKRSVYRIVHLIRQYFGFSDQEKLNAVAHLIGLGAGTVDDLVIETSFRQQEIYEIITQLERDNRIKIQSFSDGRPGPPRKLLVPIQ